MNAPNTAAALALAVLMSLPLHAAPVLGAGYKPTTEQCGWDKGIAYSRNPGDVLQTAEEIARLLPCCDGYENMEPELRKYVDRNKDHYFAAKRDKAVLYRNLEAGFQLIVQHNARDYGTVLLDRLRYDPGDAAWEYPKTKAVNPKTKKPWIALSKKELADVEKETGQRFSEEDVAYLRDLLSIINENFHFYYGMPFATVERDYAAFKKRSRKGKSMEDYKKSLMGNLLPMKIMTFTPAGIDLLYGEESEQRKAISCKLGRPVYDVIQLFKEDYGEEQYSNHCSMALMAFQLKDGQRYQFLYFNSVKAAHIDPENIRRQMQVHVIRQEFPKMAKGLVALMEEQGVNVQDEANNTTPRTRALYHILHVSMNYLHAVNHHPYVKESKTGKKKDNFEGMKALYEAVPLPKKLRPMEDVLP